MHPNKSKGALLLYCIEQSEPHLPPLVVLGTAADTAAL